MSIEVEEKNGKKYNTKKLRTSVLVTILTHLETLVF